MDLVIRAPNLNILEGGGEREVRGSECGGEGVGRERERGALERDIYRETVKGESGWLRERGERGRGGKRDS
jgi:hypothetical protein